MTDNRMALPGETIRIGRTFRMSAAKESVDHPSHYGGKDNPIEAIKVIEGYGLDFHLGNVVKYILRAGKKGAEVEDLRKAAWYLNRAIEQRNAK